MSRVLIVSDTHGSNALLREIVKKEKPFDLMIHCGDAECTEGELTAIADTPIYVVQGNNDYFYDFSKRVEFNFSGIHFLVTHGHYDKVNYGMDTLFYKAKESNADVVLFGHTHVPFLKEIEGIKFINPGSLTYPRQVGHEPTYMIMDIFDQKKLNIELKKCSKSI